MALTAKEKLFNLLDAQGWVQDPRAFKAKGRYTQDEFVLDRNFQVKDAAHGGQWRIRLEWTRKGSTWQTYEGDRIKSAHVTYAPEGIEYETSEKGLWDRTEYKGIGIIEKVDTGWKHSYIWEALKTWDNKTSNWSGTRPAIEAFIKNPDLAVWLGAEAGYEADVKAEKECERRDRERVARARPLPVTVSQESVNYGWSEWKRLAVELTSAAKHIVDANGTSDLPRLVAEAHLALAAIEGVLTEEASLEMGEYIMNSVILAEESVSA